MACELAPSDRTPPPSGGVRPATGTIARAHAREELGEVRALAHDPLGTLGRELREPLSLLRRSLEDVLDDESDPLDDRQRERVRFAHGQGARLATFIDVLIDGGEPAEAIAVARRGRRRAESATLPRVGAPVEHVSARARVLVVDDHEAMRDYVVMLLRAHHDVEAAEDGAKALELAIAHPPDLVLSDLEMPRLDGVELLRALRANELTRATSVILFSAEGDEARNRALDAGADDYVVKPFGARDLLARVSAHLATARVRRELSRRESAARADAALAARRACEAERRLAAAMQAERRLELLAEELRSSSFELDVNDAAGLERWLERIDPSDRERVRISIVSALGSSARPFRDEYRVRRRDGTIAVVKARAVLEPQGTSGAHRLVGVTVDVTDRRVAEARLRSTHRSEAIGMLAAGVTHEINNMMTAVIGFGEQALGSLEPALPTHGDVHEMIRAARRAVRVTEQLAAFGSTAPPPSAGEGVELLPIVEATGAMVQRLLGADIALTITAPPVRICTRAHSADVEQSIVEVALAIRASLPKGGGAASIDVLEDPGGPSRPAHPVVELTGVAADPGAPPGPGAAVVLDGALATAATLLRASGGRVERIVGDALCLRVRLHLPGVGDPQTGRPEELAPATILVVEDEPMIRTLLRRVLERAGFRVLEAAHGGEALELVTSLVDAPALVVSDLVMPHVSGRELADALRARGVDVPVLFMSAYSGDHIVENALLGPGARFVQKPFAPDQLLREVTRVLDERSRARQTR